MQIPRMHNMYQKGTVKSQIEIVPSWQLAPYSQLPIRQLALSVERTGFNSSTYARIKPVAIKQLALTSQLPVSGGQFD